MTTQRPYNTRLVFNWSAFLQKFSSYAILLIVAAIVATPIVWLVITSFKQTSEYLSYPIKWLPSTPNWENYQLALTMIPYLKYVGNSLFLALIFATLTIATSSAAGFAFARLSGPYRGKLFGIVIALLIVPNIVVVIPQFVIFAQFHMTDTYWPWVLWALAASPFHIFLFRQFFASIPKELEDAAEVDGAGAFRIYWQIFLPNAKPAIATSFIINFAWVWGDWFLPVIYLNDNNTTLAVKLATGYADPHGNLLVTIALAGSVLYLLPMVIMFFLGQKHLIAGVVTSGLKG
jgi:multiple sugar transport system permease protein